VKASTSPSMASVWADDAAMENYPAQAGVNWEWRASARHVSFWGIVLGWIAAQPGRQSLLLKNEAIVPIIRRNARNACHKSQ